MSSFRFVRSVSGIPTYSDSNEKIVILKFAARNIVPSARLVINNREYPIKLMKEYDSNIFGKY